MKSRSDNYSRTKTSMAHLKLLIGFLVIVLCCAGSCWLTGIYYESRISKIENANIIVISKQDMQLRLIDYEGNTLFCAPVATGKAYGNKQKQGDMRTPEGVFQVSDIQDASKWSHDFGDGKGEIKGAYGDYFIRLDVPGHKGIGIHGTHDPESIGSRASEGCIRLRNEDLNKLVSLIYPPMTVIVTPSAIDEYQNVNK